MFPVRCYTCNTVLAHLHESFDAHAQHVGTKTAFHDFRIDRICCRRMFLGFVDLSDGHESFGNVDTVLDKGGTVLRRHVGHARTASCD